MMITSLFKSVGITKRYTNAHRIIILQNTDNMEIEWNVPEEELQIDFWRGSPFSVSALQIIISTWIRNIKDGSGEK